MPPEMAIPTAMRTRPPTSSPRSPTLVPSRFPPRLWRLLGAHGISADEVKSRFGRYFAVAGQQRKGARLVAYHLTRK